MIVVQGIIFYAWTLVNAVLCGWAALMLYGLCIYWWLCPLSGFFLNREPGCYEGEANLRLLDVTWPHTILFAFGYGMIFSGIEWPKLWEKCRKFGAKGS